MLWETIEIASSQVRPISSQPNSDCKQEGRVLPQPVSTALGVVPMNKGKKRPRQPGTYVFDILVYLDWRFHRTRRQSHWTRVWLSDTKGFSRHYTIHPDWQQGTIYAYIQYNELIIFIGECQETAFQKRQTYRKQLEVVTKLRWIAWIIKFTVKFRVFIRVVQVNAILCCRPSRSHPGLLLRPRPL